MRIELRVKERTFGHNDTDLEHGGRRWGVGRFADRHGDGGSRSLSPSQRQGDRKETQTGFFLRMRSPAQGGSIRRAVGPGSLGARAIWTMGGMRIAPMVARNIARMMPSKKTKPNKPHITSWPMNRGRAKGGSGLLDFG